MTDYEQGFNYHETDSYVRGYRAGQKELLEELSRMIADLHIALERLEEASGGEQVD